MVGSEPGQGTEILAEALQTALRGAGVDLERVRKR